MTLPLPVSLENLAYLGAGFLLGVVIGLVGIGSGFLFFSARLRQVSDQARHAHQTIEPVQECLNRYETRLNAMESARARADGAIAEKLAQMTRAQHLLHLETNNLVKALRVPHVRGRWGEITLRKVAELAGMARHCDFVEQLTASDRQSRLRPDMVVTLPSGRQVVVDAKVPLLAYLDALEAQDPAEQEARMADHARQVAAHITLLSAKNYAAAFAPSPEFVVLFIPGENFFSAALTHRPDLIEFGVSKGVILATPTTLIALLKSVAYSWQQKTSHEHAEKIRELAVQLYRNLCDMAGHINRLGKDIDKCATSFNKTVGILEQKVMIPARKLEGMGIAAGDMPDLEPASAAPSATLATGEAPHDPET